MVIVEPLNVTWVPSVIDIVLVSVPSEITMFPVFATTFSLNVRTILPFLETPVALSAGVELLSVGLVVSEVVPVVKFKVVSSLIPE